MTKFYIRRLAVGIPLGYLAYKIIYFLWLATAMVLGEI